MFLSKISIDFMYDHLLLCRREHFCYCLHVFITKEILKCDIKDCFEINGKQMIKMPKKCEYVKFKIHSFQLLKVFQFLKIMESKIHMNLILTNMKNMLLVVIIMNQYVLMINVVSLLNDTQAKMLFAALAVGFKKVNIGVM